MDVDGLENQISTDFAYIVEVDTDGVTIFDSEWRYVYVNAAAEKLYGRPRTDLLGSYLPEKLPHAFYSPTFDPVKKVMKDRVPAVVQVPSAGRPGMWREARCVPVDNLAGSGPNGLLVYWRDVTETRILLAAKAEADQRATAAGLALDAVQDAFITLDEDFRIVYANAEAGRINGKPVHQFIGRIFWDEWPTAAGTITEERCRRAMLQRSPEHFLRHWVVPSHRDMWLEISIYPDKVNGGLHLVYRDITERHNRELRERFLAGLAERARTLTDPDDVIADAVTSVGTFLDVDRCLYSDLDIAANTSTIHKDYCKPGVKSATGVWKISDFGEYIIGEFKAGRPTAVSDVRTDTKQVPPGSVESYEEMGAIAHCTVPFVRTSVLVSAMAIHSTQPRKWKQEEIDLLQMVVERTWLTIAVTRQNQELARLRERDGRIAEQLQLALVPDLPVISNDLALRRYYRAALKEASVGGDFADCFECAGGTKTCVVLGDVSGKGLQAASQVAMVRNMLRFAIQTNCSLSNAVSQLNSVLCEVGELNGFATIFVGVYDSANKVLDYVNCGQEPGLVWHPTTSSIELLSANSAVIGAISDSTFISENVRLHAGDVFALFTDGFTEAGPTRHQLLSIDGVAAIFQSIMENSYGNDSAHTANTALAFMSLLEQQLLARVEQFAGGPEALRDDIALLLVTLLDHGAS